jgi:hypothetical protein
VPSGLHSSTSVPLQRVRPGTQMTPPASWQEPATHTLPWAEQSTGALPVPVALQMAAVVLLEHVALPGAHTMGLHVPAAQAWLAAQGVALKLVPVVLHMPAVTASRQRVCPGVHAMGTQRPPAQASEAAQGAAVSEVPVELQTSCTPLVELQRSEKGAQTGAVQAFAVESQEVEQNWRKAHALPVGVHASSVAPLHRLSPGVQMELAEAEQAPLAQPSSQLCTTSYPEPSGTQASMAVLSTRQRVVLGVHACATQAPLLHRPAQLCWNA